MDIIGNYIQDTNVEDKVDHNNFNEGVDHNNIREVDHNNFKEEVPLVDNSFNCNCHIGRITFDGNHAISS